MKLRFTPNIKGSFVNHVMNDSIVAEHMNKLGITKEQAHDFVKSIMIVTGRDLDVDINKVINDSLR